MAIGLLLACLLAMCLSSGSIVYGRSYNREIRPIRIGLAIDEHSMKEIHVLIDSVVTVAHSKADLVFHILVCGKDELTARRLKTEVEGQLAVCFPSQRFELQAFFLPADTGFGAQLTALKRKSHHWNSPSGADMARFFLASAFPQAQRLLYLDNDITVSCCLEEIFDSPLDGQAVGIALDDLNWAVVTQFQRHYNASHPLVIENMRRNQTAYYQSIHAGETITKQEFAKLVPRYPNDGVILFDVQRYNALPILKDMDRIAQANADGEYVVGLGTQQFTVLTMYDRWKELSPRANLRHFPDMARGYMMWFYYTGILHYAGSAKPRTLCHVDSFKDNNWHRVQSFTPWLLSNHHLSQQCGAAQSPLSIACNRHLLVGRHVFALLKLFFLLVEASGEDRELLYLRLGGRLAATAQSAYEGDLAYVLRSLQTLVDVDVGVNSTQLNCSTAQALQLQSFNLLDALDRMVLHSTQWDVRLHLLPAEKQLQAATSQLEPFNITYSTSSSAHKLQLLPRDKKKQKKAPSKQSKKQRRVTVVEGSWCSNHHNHSVYIPQALQEVTSSDGLPCQSVLLDIKAAGYKHWEPVLITVEYGSNQQSLSVLRALDLVFMRPKLILVALRQQDNSSAQLIKDVEEAEAFFSRAGFSAGSSLDRSCLPSTGSLTVFVWGVRMNMLEFA